MKMPGPLMLPNHMSIDQFLIFKVQVLTAVHSPCCCETPSAIEAHRKHELSPVRVAVPPRKDANFAIVLCFLALWFV